MADRPCRLRLKSALLTALLLSSPMMAHALGLATPQVMSGFNEPLKARVALLDTGDLRADDIRVSLADNARWQAMEIDRSADTDTLRLAVDGRPGDLYLDVRGSRPLATPWLDVVLTLRWPQGELTPQLTLLPSSGATAGEEMATAAPSSAPGARHRAEATGNAREPAAERQRGEAPAATVDAARIAALEGRLDRLEQQLRASHQAQASLMADLETVRAQSSVDRSPMDTGAVEALASRQQALETRLDRLDQDALTAGVSAPGSAAPEETPQQAVSPRETAVTPLPEPAATGRDAGFVWTWALAALLLLAAGGWAGVRRWRQGRYRLVSAAELSQAGEGAAASPAASGRESEGDGRETGRADAGQDEAWAAHRAQIEAICSEAEVFHQYGRRDHAITMLREGLEQYPDDVQLMRALAALEAAHDSAERHDDSSQGGASPPAAGTPSLAPAWSLQASAEQDEVIEAVPGAGTASVSGTGAAAHAGATAGYPGEWALEEVAFEGANADNERPDGERPTYHTRERQGGRS
ncbi:hypothetical protein M1D97_07015 [Kushneria sp. AK178]